MNSLKLYDRQWMLFQVEDLFDINIRGKRIVSNNRKIGLTPLVTAGESTNGISGFIENKNHKSYFNSITLDMFGNAFYQDFEFKCDDNITVLKNDSLNKYSAMFIITLLRRLREKYSYGNQIRPNRLRKDKLLLPVNDEMKPDWKFMETFMKHIEQNKVKILLNYFDNKKNKEIMAADPIRSDPIAWKPFEIGLLCNIKSGVRLTKHEMLSGNIPFIGASDSNNGVTEFISNINSSLDENVLGVNYNGSVVDNFYHPYQCVFSDDVKRLELKDRKFANKWVYLFLKIAIIKQKSKYQYGYKFNTQRILKQKILLPINKEDKPDYILMENKIKHIEINSILSILKYYNK